MQVVLRLVTYQAPILPCLSSLIHYMHVHVQGKTAQDSVVQIPSLRFHILDGICAWKQAVRPQWPEQFPSNKRLN